MVQPFRQLWSNVQKLESIKNKISAWHKAMYTGNYNKQWLEHTDCPDIVWERWCKFPFQRKFAQ